MLVSDTSVLIDLERGEIVEAAFQMGYDLAVPDILYARELQPYNGNQLLKLGLKRVRLDGDALASAVEYRRREQRISLVDSISLAVCKRYNHILLTGDATLRKLAEDEGVDCNGLLWLFDFFEEKKLLTRSQLFAALTKIAEHPRCRLPKRQVNERLTRYSSKAKR